MKAFFNSTLVAFSMFSSLPMPQKRIKWDEQGMRYIMAAFPVVGIVIGAVVCAWVWFSAWLGLPDVPAALGLMLIPVAITGGIHLDGLADTCDALKANVSTEQRRDILKDPRAGAFAVIGVAVYLISYFGLVIAFDRSLSNVILLCVGFVLSRSLSGLGVILLPSVSDGTAKMFHDASVKRSAGIPFFFILLCVAVATGMAAAGQIGIVTLLLWLFVQLCCFLYLKSMARRKFGGMSGDLAGWFLQICELSQLAVIVVCTHWRFS